eukprot:1172761-Pyramimonas_sp.AAC.1
MEQLVHGPSLHVHEHAPPGFVALTGHLQRDDIYFANVELLYLLIDLPLKMASWRPARQSPLAGVKPIDPAPGAPENPEDQRLQVFACSSVRAFAC